MLKTVSTQLALASDTLPEVLANGNTTGGTDLIVSSGDTLFVSTTSQPSSSSFGTTIGRNSSPGLIESYRNTGVGAVANIGGTGGNMLIRGDGDLENTNNSYGAISDIKVKENITDATPKLSGILGVRIVNYNLIDRPDLKQIGVVAQELELVFPALVKASPDLDEEGEDLGTVTKSVKYSVFVPMLIKAMQEQQEIIESLTARIEALEA